MYILILIFVIILIFVFINKSIKKIEKYENKGIYTAIILEPREHKALEYVLNNFLDNLSDEWNFIVFHGSKNI